MPAKRLGIQPHELINRKQLLSFVFEGESVEGFGGDVVTSALLANDRMVMARSFKYHRPRGVLSFANHDANVLLHAGERTNLRADLEPIVAGRSYRAVNTYGGLRFDAAQALQLFSPVLPVGFYYKAFYRPRFMFPWWERVIRNLAGLGRVDEQTRAQRLPRRNRFCDVLVVGGGVAGMAAARRCAEDGKDVVIADENTRLGGTYDYLHVRDEKAQSDYTQTLRALNERASVEVLVQHFAAGYYADRSVPLVGPAGLVHVHAKQIVFATGLYEQPAVFRNNDLAGVMLATAAQRLVHRYAVAPCENAVVLAGNDEAYAAACDLQDAGIRIAAIVDLDDPSRRGEVVFNAIARGIQVIPRAAIEQTQGRRGRVVKVTVRSNDGASTQTIDCDGLLMSVGWAPAAGLLYQAGAKLAFDTALGQVTPEELPPDCHAAGRLNGVFDYADQLADGIAAAEAALLGLGSGHMLRTVPQRAQTSHSHPFPIMAHPRGKDFIDFDEDLTVKDLKIGVREGFDSIELLKRYSTIGMGPSQGKTSNMNGVRLLAHLNATPVGAVGVTTPRPFTHPVAMGVLAGRRLRREWTTPIHAYHAQVGADLQPAGTWQRPMSYTSGSPRSAIEREYTAVRERAGIIDVSTLGKIELFGPGALKLLEYAYTCSFDKLATGMTRYVFMVDGSGTLVDDGVCARFAEDHFYLTATSSHAQAVVRQLQLYAHQLKLDVSIVDRTFQVGAINLAGPQSRRILSELIDIEIGDSAFPYLAVREGAVAGIPVRALRVGFVGELGYELHFPASAGPALWRALMAAGLGVELEAFGVEAQRLLRLEKGHLIFGQDTDGTTNPFEANLGWGVRLSKPQFIGKHSLNLLKPRLARRLVGFSTFAEAAAQMRECHLVIERGAIAGRVTSVAYSPHCRATIGLAMIDLPLVELGREFSVRVSDGSLFTATQVHSAFYDADNLRQRDDDGAQAGPSG